MGGYQKITSHYIYNKLYFYMNWIIEWLLGKAPSAIAGGKEAVVMDVTKDIMQRVETAMQSIDKNFSVGAEDFSLFGAIGYWNEVYAKIGDVNQALGVSGNLGAAMKEQFKDAFIQLGDVGIEADQIAKNLQKFLESSGRVMIVSTEELVEMSQMAKVFGEDSIDILNTYRELGISIKTTTARMKQLTIESNKYGVLPSRAVKLIKDNLSAVDKYYFKGGTKAFEQMALKAASLNNDMKGAFTMIDKILDGGIEGAVELAQEFQIMGGPIAQMGDVFGLMQKALSGDIEGLTNDMAKAAAQMATMGKNGEIMFDPAAMMQFRQLASKAGVEIGEITRLGKAMFKEMEVGKQLDLSLKAVPEQFEAMSKKVAGAVTGQDAFGNWLVTIDGIEKKVQDLTKEDIEAKLSITPEGTSPEDTFKEIIRTNMDLSEVMKTFVAEIKKSALGGAGSYYNEFLELFRKTADTGADTLKVYIDEYVKVSKGAYENLLGVVKPLSEGDIGSAVAKGTENLTDAATGVFNAGSQALYEVSKVLGNILWNAGKLLISAISYGFEYGAHKIKLMLYEVWNNTFGAMYSGAQYNIKDEEKKMKSFSEYMKDVELSPIFQGFDGEAIWKQLTETQYEALSGLNKEQSDKVRRAIPEDKATQISGKDYIEVGGTIMLKTPDGERALTKEENIQLLKDLSFGTKNQTSNGN